MKRVEEITIDVKNKEYDEIRLKQMDTTQLIFKMLDNSKEMDLTGTEARIIFTKPNRTVVIQSATINDDKKSITADLKKDCVRGYGRGKIEVEILKDDEVLSSFYLNAQIEKTSKEDLASSDTPNYFEELEDALTEFKKSEETRVSNEKERIKAEENRAKEEEKRVEQEEGRVSEESSRVEAEKLRVQAEKERESEIKRLEQENKTLRNIVDNVLPYEANEGENLTLKNTTGAPFKKLEIEGNSYQETSEQGKNILDLTKADNSEFRLIIDDISTNEITLTVTQTGSSNFVIMSLGDFKAGTYYFKVKFELLEGTEAARTGLVRFGAKISNTNKTVKDFDKGQTGSFVLTEDCELSMTFYLAGDDPSTDIIKARFYDIMISNENVEYEPFVPNKPSLDYSSSIKAVGDNGSANTIISNENLLNIEKNASAENFGIKITTDENAIVTLNGTSTSQMFIQLSGDKIKISNTSTNLSDLSLPKQKLKLISQKISGTANGNLHFYLREKNSGANVYEKHINDILNSENIKTVDADLTNIDIDKFVVYLWCAKDNTFDNVKFQFQLKPEEALTDYIPHEEQNISVPVQQPMLEGDYFDLERGKEVHIWKKVDLSTITTNQFYKNSAEGDPKPRWGTNYFEDMLPTSKLLCTHLKQVSNSDTYNKTEGISAHGTTSTLYLYINGVYDNDSLRQALDKMTLYYQQITPTELDLTEEQKIALQQLNEAETYKGTTLIFSTDEISPIYKTEHYLSCQSNNEEKLNEIETLLTTTKTGAFLIENLEEDLTKEVE